jgi:hypothetical protein
MNPEIAALLTELVEKMGLLRNDMKKRGELAHYEARFARIEQKVSSLSDRLTASDPELAKSLRTAWQLPGRSLAFRNVEHQIARSQESEDRNPSTGDRRQKTDDGD